MTEAALQELIKREFPAEMPVTEVADKLDTMQTYICQTVLIFKRLLIFLRGSMRRACGWFEL